MAISNTTTSLPPVDQPVDQPVDAPVDQPVDAPIDHPTNEPKLKRKFPLIELITVAIFAVLIGMFVIPAIRDVLEQSALDSAEPVQYSSEELGFSAEFPGAPAVETATEREAGIELEVTTTTWTSQSRTMGIAVAEIGQLGIPDLATIAPAEADAFLQSMMEDAVANIPGAALIDSEFGELGGQRSIEATITSEAGLGTYALVIANGKIFSIFAGASDDDEETAFLRSFELIPAS